MKFGIEEARRLIVENQQTQDPFLDLGNLGLAELPEELWELAHLKRLNLGVQYLNEDGKWQECRGPSWVEVMLGGKQHFRNHLTHISKHIKGLSCLEGFFIESNFMEDISFLQGLTNLTELHLGSNQIKDISFLQGLTNLTSLDLPFNQIQGISFLQGLTNLTSLNLGANQIQDISFLQGLTNLTTLDLKLNQIQDISFLQGLTNLTSLSLDGNQIQDFSFLQGLTNLTELNLYDNQIEDISFLQELTNLTSLNLDGNQIQDISFLQGLTNLASLNLDSNQIEDFSFLQGLTNLASLNLDGNQIQDISFLQGLTNLTSLNLDYNQIQDIFFLRGLTNLTKLRLRQNQIQQFLKPFFELPYLRELDLRENPIADVPYEIINQDNCLEDARNWFHDLSQGKMVNYEVKLLLTGNGRVGKSCILDRLQGRDYDPGKPSTHAIQIERKAYDFTHLGEARTLDVQVWDFGGQEIYHATHRHFMRTRALYLVVWDALTEERDGVTWFFDNYRLPYWLDYVRAFSKNSPVIVVQNKKDRDGRLRPPSEDELNELCKPKDCVSLSAADGTGFAQLEEVMLEAFLEMPEVGMEMPLRWHEVRRALLERAAAETDIAFEEFDAVCEEKQVRPASRPSLLRYLHDTGAVFYQKDLFGSRLILDQRWAIEAVYLIFDRGGTFFRLKRGSGNFRFSDLDIPLDNTKYSPEKRKVIASFMESCEIIFKKDKDARFEDDPEYVAPELLPADKPVRVRQLWEQPGEDCLWLLCEHPVLHKAFITRFLVRAGHLAEFHDLWRSGIHFRHGNAEALVEAHHLRKEGVIRVQVRGAGREELLRLVRREFRDIQHQSEELPQWVSLDGAAFVDLQKLREEDRLGNAKMSDRNGREVEVAAHRLFLRERREREDGRPEKGLRDLPPQAPAAPRALKLFISYAHEDETHKDRLCDELLTWQVVEKIEIFHDRMLGAGLEIDRTLLEEKLRQSDIVCLLVSRAFLKSKYILPKEVAIAMQLHEQGKARVVPIILETVNNYRELPFGKLVSIPDDLNPVCGCADEDAAWRKINEKISAIIEEKRKG